MYENIFCDVDRQIKGFCWKGLAAMVRGWLEEFLHQVLLIRQQEAIGAGWHQRCDRRSSWRNGYRARGLGTSFGDLVLKVPRNRHGSYGQNVFDRFSRRSQELEKEILEVFALGVSTRGLSRWLEDLQIGLSPAGISLVLRQVDAQARAWHQRSLPDDRWRFVVLDGMWVRLMGAKRVVLVAMGITREGLPELIDYRVAEWEDEPGWEGFVRDLFQRGLEGKGTELFVSDGADAIWTAVSENYPGKKHQWCAFHKLEDIGRHLVEQGHRKEILEEAGKIYDSEGIQEARERARQWARRWRKREPEAVRTFLSGLARTLVYYKFDRAFWPLIRTTNVLERYLRELRRRLKNICAYQSEQSIDRMVFLAINGVAKRGYPYDKTKTITHNT
jgi:transposase-like protein